MSAGAVADGVVGGRGVARNLEDAPAGLEQLAARAGVGVGLVVEAEVGSGEGPVIALGFVEDTQLVTSYRNRLQPIGFRYESSALFSPPSDGAAPNFRVTFTPAGGGVTELKNVHGLRVDLINRGNSDRAKMTLGISIPAGQGIVHAEKTAGDRHHRLRIEGEFHPDAPSNEIDVVLEPFNRGDAYTLTLYVTLPLGEDEAGPIVFSSPDAVRFVALPDPNEVALEALEIGGSFFVPRRLLGLLTKSLRA